MFSIGASKRPNSISLEYNCFFPLLESYFKTVDSGTSVLLTSPSHYPLAGLFLSFEAGSLGDPWPGPVTYRHWTFPALHSTEWDLGTDRGQVEEALWSNTGQEQRLQNAKNAKCSKWSFSSLECITCGFQGENRYWVWGRHLPRASQGRGFSTENESSALKQKLENKSAVNLLESLSQWII